MVVVTELKRRTTINILAFMEVRVKGNHWLLEAKNYMDKSYVNLGTLATTTVGSNIPGKQGFSSH